jgi:hypothetical protein
VSIWPRPCSVDPVEALTDRTAGAAG